MKNKITRINKISKTPNLCNNDIKSIEKTRNRIKEITQINPLNFYEQPQYQTHKDEWNNDPGYNNHDDYNNNNYYEYNNEYNYNNGYDYNYDYNYNNDYDYNYNYNGNNYDDNEHYSKKEKIEKDYISPSQEKINVKNEKKELKTKPLYKDEKSISEKTGSLYNGYNLNEGYKTYETQNVIYNNLDNFYSKKNNYNQKLDNYKNDVNNYKIKNYNTINNCYNSSINYNNFYDKSKIVNNENINNYDVINNGYIDENNNAYFNNINGNHKNSYRDNYQ